jgi:hypothetical protein
MARFLAVAAKYRAKASREAEEQNRDKLTAGSGQ